MQLARCGIVPSSPHGLVGAGAGATTAVRMGHAGACSACSGIAAGESRPLPLPLLRLLAPGLAVPLSLLTARCRPPSTRAATAGEAAICRTPGGATPRERGASGASAVLEPCRASSSERPRASGVRPSGSAPAPSSASGSRSSSAHATIHHKQENQKIVSDAGIELSTFERKSGTAPPSKKALPVAGTLPAEHVHLTCVTACRTKRNAEKTA